MLWRISRAARGDFWLPYAPSETLIGQERYLKSRRAVADLRRGSTWGLGLLNEGGGLAEDLSGPAQCIVKSLK